MRALTAGVILHALVESFMSEPRRSEVLSPMSSSTYAHVQSSADVHDADRTKLFYLLMYSNVTSGLLKANR